MHCGACTELPKLPWHRWMNFFKSAPLWRQWMNACKHERHMCPFVIPKGSFRLVACGCKSAADCGKDVYFLRQMVAFLHGDRKFPISALMQPTTDARGKRSNVNEPLLCTTADGYFCPVFSSPAKVHWLKLEPLTKRLKANHQSHSTSVTRWLDYFSIFGHLQWWKLAQKCHKFGKVSLVFCLKEMNGQKYA